MASETIEEENLNNNIRPGSIVYLFCKFIGNPHHKYIVIVHLEEDYILGFFINSMSYGFIQNHKELKHSQIPISKAEYPFLDHDSYIDCMKTIDEFTPEEIDARIQQDPAVYIGELLKEHAEKVLEAIGKSITLSGIEKQKISEALGQYYL